jgi:TPR repeat protein
MVGPDERVVQLALAALVLCACKDAPATKPAVASEPPCLIDAVTIVRLKLRENAACTEANQQCRDLCEGGDADACMSRAVAIERGSNDEAEARSLFERACKLGLANACTNWAATVWAVEDNPPARCLVRTFEKTCASGDHFGCGMAGRLRVSYRVGFAALPRARIELETSCMRLGGFPCRILALNGERGMFPGISRQRIRDLMKQACEGDDTPACGTHATVEETFDPD